MIMNVKTFDRLCNTSLNNLTKYEYKYNRWWMYKILFVMHWLNNI